MRRVVKWLTLGVCGLVMLSVGRDALHFNPAQAAATPYLFDLVSWEAANVLDKWLHKATQVLPWNSLSGADRLALVQEYFALGEEARSLQSQIDTVAASVPVQTDELSDLESRLSAIRSRREDVRADVEEAIEGAVSAAAADEDLGTVGKLVLPPVDIRLVEPPKLLVTSPRDRIERMHDVLLRSDVAVKDREEVESAVLEDSDMAAVVLDIGGLATFPASIPGSQSLRWTMQLSAHEWVHHYLFFRPLGQQYSTDPELQTLNETVASIAGRELGDKAFEHLGGTVEATVSSEAEDPADRPEDEFDFNTEMRETRIEVEALLGDGLVDDAEAYMEERRLLFVRNGFHIRKLNQAYFAFHGTYADTAASISPIGDQLREFRELSPDLGSFMDEVSRISSYQQFLEALDRIRNREHGQ